MEAVGEGLYECVVFKGFELAANLWLQNNEPFRTNDLFIQEPPGSGFFVLKGRKDDTIVHSNGENTSAGSLQLDIQTASKVIKKVLALGHSEPCVSLLVRTIELITVFDRSFVLMKFSFSNHVVQSQIMTVSHSTLPEAFSNRNWLTPRSSRLRSTKHTILNA